MSLGKRIKTARERLKPKRTQADVAAEFKVSAQAVSGWERNDTIPELDKIAPLAKLLRVPVIWLLTGSTSPPPPDSLDFEMDHLSAEERSQVRHFIEAVRRGRSSAA